MWKVINKITYINNNFATIVTIHNAYTNIYCNNNNIIIINNNTNNNNKNNDNNNNNMLIFTYKPPLIVDVIYFKHNISTPTRC